MSSEEDTVVDFAARLAAAKAKRGVSQPAVPATPQAPTSTAPTSGATPSVQIPEEDIPVIELNLDPEEQALDDAIKNLTILDAYAKWCGKMTPNVGNKREGIMVSCPDPAHPDMNPSAWVNLDKNTYYCPGCAYGGDVWDIAALAYGFPVPGYKNDPATFRKLRQMMGLDLGFSIVKGYSGTFMVPPEDEQTGSTQSASAPAATPAVEVSDPAADSPATGEVQPPSVPVGKLPSAVEYEQKQQDYLANQDAPTSQWREWVPENTFLREWMEQTTLDNCPEEFHLWTGLMSLGFAVGRKKLLFDFQPVVGNLFVCLVGPSGSGKSRASGHLDTILRRALPWDSGTFSGVKKISQPGSAEYLVSVFDGTEEDPTNPGATIQHSIKGLIEFGELSTLMGIGGRSGSILKPQLMDIYDAKLEISGGSLSNGYRSAREPFGQCFSTTQNGSLNKLMDRSDDTSGFMNRWVFAQGPIKPPISLGGTAVNLDKPVELLGYIHTWSYTGVEMIQWSPEAAQTWDEFFHQTLYPTKTQAEVNGSSILNRIDLLMKKLILLFTVNLMKHVVPKEAVEQAIKLYPYLLKTFGVVSSQLAVTEDSDLRDKVLGAIEKLTAANGQGPTKRDIYHSVKSTIKTTKQLGDLLKSMVDLEIIVEMIPVRKPGQRGQLGVRYAVAN